MASQLLFIGTTELLLIAGVALLMFGGKKLPEMMRGLGQGVREFKKGVNDMNDAVEEPGGGATASSPQNDNPKADGDEDVAAPTQSDGRQG